MKITYNGCLFDLDYNLKFICHIWVGDNFGFRVEIKNDKIHYFRRFGACNGLSYPMTNYNLEHVLLGELYEKLKDNHDLLLKIIKNSKSVNDEIENDIKRLGKN